VPDGRALFECSSAEKTVGIRTTLWTTNNEHWIELFEKRVKWLMKRSKVNGRQQCFTLHHGHGPSQVALAATAGDQAP